MTPGGRGASAGRGPVQARPTRFASVWLPRRIMGSWVVMLCISGSCGFVSARIAERGAPDSASEPPDTALSNVSADPQPTTTTIALTPQLECPVLDSVTAQAAAVVMPGIGANDVTAARTLFAEPTPPRTVFVNTALTAELRTFLRDLSTNHRVLAAIDEEGGRVQRLNGLYGELASAATLSKKPDAIEAIAKKRASQLRDAGVNMDFGPVVDLRLSAGNAEAAAIVGDRSFGASPDSVSDLADRFASGLNASGVLPTLKHFPGHGSASGDSHLAVATTEHFDVLVSRDVAPFRAIVDHQRAAIMVGNLDVPGLTEPGRPASLSPTAYKHLREDLHFDGLVVTDDLEEMKAVSSRFRPQAAAAEAITAGADVALLHTMNQYDASVQEIVSRVNSGSLPKERLNQAARRILHQLGCS